MKTLKELKAILTQELLELERLAGIWPSTIEKRHIRERAIGRLCFLAEEDLSPPELITLMCDFPPSWNRTSGKGWKGSLSSWNNSSIIVEIIRGATLCMESVLGCIPALLPAVCLVVGIGRQSGCRRFQWREDISRLFPDDDRAHTSLFHIRPSFVKNRTWEIILGSFYLLCPFSHQVFLASSTQHTF